MNEHKTLLVIGDNPYEMVKKYGPDNEASEPYVKYRYDDRDRIYRNMIKAAEMMRMDESSLMKLKGMGADVYFSNLGVGYDCDEYGNITTFENPELRYDYIWEDDRCRIPMKSDDCGCVVGNILFSYIGTAAERKFDLGKLGDEYLSMFPDTESLVKYNNSAFATNAVLGKDGWVEFDPTKQKDFEWVNSYERLVTGQCGSGDKVTLFCYH